MKAAEVSKYFGYGMAFIMASTGILLLFGFLVAEADPPQVRIMFGVVLILFGIYRFFMTRIRASRAERDNE